MVNWYGKFPGLSKQESYEAREWRRKKCGSDTLVALWEKFKYMEVFKNGKKTN